MCTSPKSASSHTATANRVAETRYDLHDCRDFADARRGFIAPIPEGRTLTMDGRVLFDLDDYAFVGDDAERPDTVNPSLWRQSQVMHEGGLYRVADGIYQVRNSEIANLTVVEGPAGLVVVDAMTSVENARQAMGLIREHVSDKPVRGVLYTHTHVDHFGGVKGVVSESDVASGVVRIVAPGLGFEKHAMGENVLVGNAMSRRASFPFGSLLGHGPRELVTCGIGIGPSRAGRTVSYLSPTDLVTRTGQTMEIAGLTFEFLYAPDTEAPEEMHIWIPELKALTCAENAQHSMHNIQTLRGARTRDARNFARYLDETLERWGDDVEVHYGPHTWPVFGHDEVVDFLSSQRDTYKYIHDEALRMANKGLTAIEAAEIIELPDALGRRWWNREYHGTLHHNVRAVYHKELGLWDGDPVSLNPLPAVESSARYVDLIGADRLLEEGRRAIEAGDYRWATEILHKLVFADAESREARELLADAYEQLGYQAEGPQWRNIYLTMAQELRKGVTPQTLSTLSPDILLGMPVGLLFDFAAVRLIGPKAAMVDLRLDYVFTDLAETWGVTVRNGVLNARRGLSTNPQVTLTGTKAALTEAILRPTHVEDAVAAGRLTVAGDRSVVSQYAALLETFDPNFAIGTPERVNG